MAALSGRKLRIKKGSTAIAGARTDNLTINNEPVDITDKDDLGWRTMLSEAGVRSVDATVEGVIVDDVLIEAVMASNLISAYTVEIDGFGDFTADWFISSLELGGEQADAVTFTANIQSSGTVTYTGDA
jgi:TP901-1 family phage major tail protein